MTPVLVVTGLKREGSVVSGEGVRIVAGGGSADRLARELAALAPGAAGIISFGMAGALDPALRLGDWVVGDCVTGAFEGPCDPRWVAALMRALPRPHRGACYADGHLIADPMRKRALHDRHSALAADMESHLAARVAADAGLPFAILRCVSDTADATLPPAIAASMKPGGGLALGAVLGSLVAHPGQLPALVHTVAGFNRAFRALGDGAREAGPRLGFDNR
ncbi:phosphorylase family protein [Novosphingobium lentum]|uniref:phosphorylase family protein n=1 Tax=Novosphingobium lentum TaxID=145287 RepID=UPI000A0730C5|nr:hypothetical protein [Novosphingobium lentum]